jgi:hypothetical protein
MIWSVHLFLRILTDVLIPGFATLWNPVINWSSFGARVQREKVLQFARQHLPQRSVISRAAKVEDGVTPIR